MSIAEMHYELDLRVDKIASSDRPDLLPLQKDAYIDRATLIFVKKLGGDEYEASKISVEKLSNLHIRSPYLQPAISVQSTTGVYEADLSTLLYDKLYLTKVEADIVEGVCTKKVTLTLRQTDDELNLFTRPDYNWNQVPYEVASSDGKSSIYVNTEGLFSLSNFYISYLKKPKRVFEGSYDHISESTYTSGSTPIDSEIDTAYHEDILDIAAFEVKRDLALSLEQNKK